MDKVNSQSGKEVSDIEVQGVIADFLDMGLVDNIVAMFRQENRYYGWTGALLEDHRFAVRLGVQVLFEHLREKDPEHIGLAVPSLMERLTSPLPWVRGEAVSVLGIIGSPQALAGVRRMLTDTDSQVAEIAEDILNQGQ